MPLTSAFNAALTGLNNNALQINVVGNNLANMSSTGYKSVKVTFAELLSSSSDSSGNGNPIQVGLGSYVPSVSPVFSQGSILYTGKSTDAAVSGNGFFIVSTGDGQAFTRAGNFGLTRDGALVTGEGFQVLGYPAANGEVGTDSTLMPITVLKGSAMPPKATENASFVANLDGRAKVGESFSAAVQVFDSLGGTHSITVSFTNGGAGAWTWNATIPATDTGGAATAAPVSIGTGSVTFDANGVLTNPTANPTLTLTGLASGASDMNITLGLWDSEGSPRLTGFSATSAVSSTNQDGHTSSVLKDISFDNKGIVNGVYDNGQVQPIAQLALANFANVEGLLKFKGTTFVNSIASGEASIGAPGSGGRGTISGSSLEQSNVDIAQEFTTLIVAQRGYQANSRVITTTDELYQDAINMKR